jgi:glyoxylase-like metal-dependent hydrolase (beta-lactamase superfamily II)
MSARKAKTKTPVIVAQRKTTKPAKKVAAKAPWKAVRSKKNTTKTSRTPTLQPAIAGQLIPPENGVTVRFYRIGHGDCFLLAFPTTPGERPAYVLIDCGYKPKSPQKIDPPNKLADILADLRTATAGHIDVAIITHEHQDHVNGISKEGFKDITIGESWFAWTENPEDDLAEKLREKYKDTLLKLLEARKQMGQGVMAQRMDVRWHGK